VYVTTANITADVKAIPLFTDTGTGEVNQARIILRALDGNYIENGNIIQKFDRIQIECTDLGGNSYDRFFEVIDIIPTQSKASGTLLTLECLGIEYHTQHIHYATPHYFATGISVAKDVGDFYNDNNGSEQPILVSHNVVFNGTIGNALPAYTANNFEFGLNEDTCYNRWMDLIDTFGASVSSGGALTFYELSFVADAINTIRFKLRASGDNTPTVTIKNAKVTNPLTVGDQEGQISNPTGTNLLAWGSPDHGSLPVDFSKYDSQIVQFQFRPEHVGGTEYVTDARVKVTDADGTAEHFKALQTTSAAPPARVVGSQTSDANWEQIDMKSEFGDNEQYSPWTDDKATLWKNAMGDPDSGTQYAWDINLVIWADNFFRTWADGRATTDAALTLLRDNGAANEGYSYDPTDSTKFPRGFRVLVDANSPTGVLANFANMVAEYDGGSWFSRYKFDEDNNKVQVAVIDEAKVYEDTITAGPVHSWATIDTSDYGNDCFHQVSSITNVAGVSCPDVTKSGFTNLNASMYRSTLPLPRTASCTEGVESSSIEPVGLNLLN